MGSKRKNPKVRSDFNGAAQLENYLEALREKLLRQRKLRITSRDQIIYIGEFRRIVRGILR